MIAYSGSYAMGESLSTWRPPATLLLPSLLLAPEGSEEELAMVRAGWR